jgi:signal transduction histidine kinase
MEVLLRKKREPEQYEDKIKEVITQTDRLNQLLDQLLQLARLEGGTVKNEISYWRTLVNEVVTKHEKQIVGKGINIKILIPDGASIFADHFFLSMIINNLFSNALKYGDTNGKIVIVWHEVNRIFSITNDGSAISPEQLPFLFDRFYRTDDSRSSQIPGSGLGLAIVKKLSDLLHIKISVTSITGSTVFSLQFPD